VYRESQVCRYRVARRVLSVFTEAFGKVLVAEFICLWYNAFYLVPKEAAMRRFALLGIVLALGLVAACGGKPSPTLSPTAIPPTATAVQPTDTAGPSATVTASGPATCVPFPLDFPPDSNLPPVTAQDHTRGPAGAPITLIEYSDFQ
jgi:hypothetical protein